MSCYSCEQNALADPPPRESIVRTAHWRVAHAFNSSLPGWLVAMPLRHITALHELTSDEAAELGPLLRDLSIALQRVTGCLKTYVMLFAEQEGFSHVHFHVVPRMADFGSDQYGPDVFWFLKRPEEDQVGPDERDRIAGELRREVERR